MRTAARIIALLVGLGLCAVYVRRVDLGAVVALWGQLGWLALAVPLPYLCVYVVDALGWRMAFPPGLTLRFGPVFRIRWCGESVNNVVPSAYVGGEAVKVYLLRRRGVSGQVGTSAAVVSKTAQTVAQLLFLMLAAAVFLGLAGDRPGVLVGMALVLGVGAAQLAVLFWLQRRGVFTSVLGVTDALGWRPAWLQHRRVRLLAVDQAIGTFYRQHRRRFLASTAIYLGGWLLDTVEIYLVARWLGAPITWNQALVVEAFTGVAKILGLWIPGSLGVQESGIVLIGRLAGLPDPLCVAYALLRRARELGFAVVGWLLLGAEGTSLARIRADAESDSKASPDAKASPKLPE